MSKDQGNFDWFMTPLMQCLYVQMKFNKRLYYLNTNNVRSIFFIWINMTKIASRLNLNSLYCHKKNTDL